ncbi:MAG: hypothetical protein DSZ28_02335 [Thiothrix sp.]|nr:MAG: hypothetical protein DSZ28_02335 [Thiothrix sp.]
MMIRIVKNSIKRVLTSIKWRFIPNGVYCFNYHRIGDSRNAQYDSDIYSCDNDTFLSHIRFYKNNFKLISTKDLEHLIKTGEVINSRFALITFDDGYIDNYSNAYKILRNEKVPATFYVPTSYIGSAITPWWDEIAWMIRNTLHDSVKIGQWKSPVPIQQNNIDASIRAVLLEVKKTYKMSMDDILIQLRKAMECQLEVSQEALFMSWDHLREMQAHGMRIGSHTHSHEILSHVGIDSQYLELKKSKEILEKELNDTISTFAYPVGRSDTYTKETIQALKSCGYTHAFTQLLGVNKRPNKNCFELRRFPVDGNIKADMIPQLVCLN